MGKSELDDLIEQLRARLDAAGEIDDADRQRLSATLRNIEAELGKHGRSPPGAHGLDALAVKFEVNHPAVADGLRRLADVLGKVGI